MLSFLIPCSEKYDGKLCHIVPTLVLMTEAVQDKLEFVCEAEMCGKLHYQVLLNVQLHPRPVLFQPHVDHILNCC